MGNRSRYLVAGAATASVAFAARRRARLRRAAEGIRDTVLPTHALDLPSEGAPGSDAGHAPGHQHLGRPDSGPRPARVRGRPWRKHAHAVAPRPFAGE